MEGDHGQCFSGSVRDFSDDSGDLVMAAAPDIPAKLPLDASEAVVYLLGRETVHSISCCKHSFVDTGAVEFHAFGRHQL